MSKKVRCEKCGGTGKEARTGLFDSTKGYPQEVDMSVDCLDCKGTGQVELTDKTIRLPEDDPGSPVTVTYKLNGEVIGRGQTLEYKPAQWLSDETEEGEIKRG